MDKRKRFSSEEKVYFLKQHLLERKEISNICEENGIQPSVFYRWQKSFFDNAVNYFQIKNNNENKKLNTKISFLEEKLSQKNEVISELMEEHIALKKNLGEN